MTSSKPALLIAAPLIKMTLDVTRTWDSFRQIAGTLQALARASIFLWILFAATLSASQCQPLGSPPAQSQSQTSTSSAAKPEFFEEPSFTIAGVTDTTSLGGHASSATVHAQDLSADVARLGNKVPPKADSSNQSEAALRAAAQNNPKNVEPNLQFGRWLAAHGKAEDAVTYLQRASALDPDKPEIHHLLGEVEEKSGNALEAVNEYRRAAELQPSEANLFDWGAELLAHNAIVPAVEVFTKGNHLFRNSARMLVGLGVARYARGAYEDAAGSLCAATDMEPAEPTAYLFLGKIQEFARRQRQGITDRFARFAKLQPDDAWAHYYYAIALKDKAGAADEQESALVESELRRAVQIDPKLAEAHLQLGIVYSNKRDIANAVAAYQSALQADPQMDEAHYRLAQVYRQSGEPSKAEKEIELYKQTSKQRAKEREDERKQIQQFVYTLREKSQ